MAARDDGGGQGDALMWSDLSMTGVAALAADVTGDVVGLVPVGATEQHGPHLPTGTDTIIATELCRRASARTGAPVLPAVPVGASYGHGSTFPGTLSLSPTLLADVVEQYALWAAFSGVRRLLFVNAHANNTAALSMATDRLRYERPDLRSAWSEWWNLASDVAAEMFADADDIHANRAETAMMLVLAPDLVDRAAMLEADDEDRTGGLVFRYTADALSSNGVTGKPSQADEELGRRLVDRTVAALAERVVAGRTEQPPLAPS